jgi:flagellar L-ring protein precursor FlgH
LAVATAFAVPAFASDASKASAKPTEDVQALYARSLEVARATKSDPAAPRWIDSLVIDPRAHAVNDLLTVKVIENMNAAGNADSSLAKNSASSASLTKLFGLETKLPSMIDPTNLVAGSSDTKFKGSGSTTRSGQLTANLTVRIAEVFPNGDMALEGAREVQINGDRQVLLLTGIVRPTDIGPGNVVLSTAIGQLRVQYIGNGLMKDSLSPGWIVRFLNKVF